MNNQQQIQDIIAMLDGSVKQGVGHINLEVAPKEHGEDSLKVETYKSTDCSKGNLACAVPTLQTSIDGE